MAYVETEPYRTEISKHILRSIEINVGANKHKLIVDSYDSLDALVKTDIVELDIFDASNNVIMPTDWPAQWPSGSDLYSYMEQAYYRRLHEEHSWLIGEGVIT